MKDKWGSKQRAAYRTRYENPLKVGIMDLPFFVIFGFSLYEIIEIVLTLI